MTTRCKEIHVHRAGQKCDYCGEAMEIEWRPYGGAVSFAELDAYDAAQEAEFEMWEQTYVLQNILDNIMSSEMDSTAKGRAIMQAGLDFHERFGREAVEAMDERAAKETKRVDGQDLNRADFADRGEADEPSTWKLPLVAESGTPDADRIADAITALQPGGFRGNEVELTNPRATVIGRIRSAIARLDDESTRDRLDKRVEALSSDKGVKTTGGLTVFRDKETGALRWLAIYSNNFEDREGEVFSKEAHAAYVKAVDNTNRYPSLRLWHVPYDIGQADCVDFADGFMVATGTFFKEFQGAALNLAEMPGLGCSHGYVYDERDLRDGVYNRYFTTEVSVLPVDKAANEMTAFAAGQEVPMLNSDKRDFFTKVLGEEGTRAAEEQIAALAATAKDRGITFKELSVATALVSDEMKVKDAAPAAASAPAEAPVAVAEPTATTEPVPTDPVAAAAAVAAAAEAANAETQEEATAAVATPEPDPNGGDAMDTESIQTALRSMIETVMAPVIEEVRSLREQVKGFDPEASRASWLADMVRPQVGPTFGQRASTSDATTTLSPESAAARAKAEEIIAAAPTAGEKPAEEPSALGFARGMLDLVHGRPNTG